MRGKVTGYLLFPGNNHVETVAMFDRLAKRGRRRKGDGGGRGGGRRRRDD